MITSESLFLVSSLGLYSFLVFVCFILLYYCILLHLILLYYYALEPCFLKRDRKGVDINGRKGKEELGKVEGSKDLQTSPHKHCMLALTSYPMFPKDKEPTAVLM